MGRLLKIFLIFLFTIFSLQINNTEACINISKNAAIYKAPYNETVILNNNNIASSAIVSSNNFNSQFYSVKTDSDNNFGIYEDIFSTNNFPSNKIKSYISKIYNFSCYGISLTLENEIFTRAP